MKSAYDLDKKLIKTFENLYDNEEVLKNLDAGFALKVQQICDVCNVSLLPSPNKDAFARFNGSTTSKHYAVGRLANAGDFFPPLDAAQRIYGYLYMSGIMGGLGLYLDTTCYGKKRPMLHLDDRNSLVKWVRYNGVYHYSSSSSGLFYDHVSEFFCRSSV